LKQVYKSQLITKYVFPHNVTNKLLAITKQNILLRHKISQWRKVGVWTAIAVWFSETPIYFKASAE